MDSNSKNPNRSSNSPNTKLVEELYLQRLTYALINSLRINCWQSWCLSRLGQSVKAGIDRIFAHFPLKISNATNDESCVPQKD
jgi:hypothetical protein